ncbi:hypothetical protein FRB98_009478 [Tulasnella sp. 332]|nr:hypothetical protein FRB98_009478 [Tulasnella sp. 332]
MSSNTHYQSIRDDSEQRQSLSDEDDISRAIFHVREHRCTRTIIFIAAVVVLIAAGLSVFLLVYVFVNHHVQWLGDQTIATTANLQDIFTISNALCIFVPLTVPLIISLHGYGVAAEWLEASRVAGSSDRPSPLQLGLLMSILQGANILSWLKVQSHLSRITRSGKRQTISPSRLLTHAAHALGLLLALAYLTTALDFWFHLSSESKALAVVLPHTPVMGDTLFGKQINETLCALYGSNATALDYQTSLGSICRLVLADPRNWPNTLAVSDLQNYFSASRLEGDRTALNTSTLNQVVFTDDQQAILVPPYIPPNVTFEADTVGVRITCQSVTKNCVDTKSTTEAPNFDCHGSPNLVIDNKAVQASPRSGEPVFGIINETGQVSSSNYPGYLPAFATVQSNPFQLASLIMTEAYVIPNQENYTFIGDTGFYYGVGGAYSLQLCEVVVNDVTYQYGSPNGSETSGFHTVSSNPSSLLTTTLIATSIDSPQIELLDFSFEPFGPPEPNIISEAYSYAYALTLSQTLLAISATIFDGSQARSLKSTQVLLGSKLHLPPLVLTLAAALAYCLCTIHIAYNAVLKSWSVDFVKLAHGHIMSPGPILRLMFNRSEPLEIWRVSDWPEVESDRLIVGIVKTREGRLVFGVTQGAQSASDARLLMSPLLVAHEAHQDGEATRDPVLGTAAQKGSIAPIVLLWLISTTLMFVPATILIVYVFNTNSFSRHGPTILTAAPLQYVLAIFKALSTAASLVPPLVTSMYAYSAASEWLRSSKVLDSTATPSPQRLGELISIVQGANLSVFFQSLHHLLPSNKRKRLPVPHILAHALLVVALLLTFSSLASGFDTWLHVSSSANIIEVFHPRPLSDVTLFGKQINETQCAYYATNPAGVTDPVHPDLPQLCGLYIPGAIDDLYSAAEGLRTLYNASESNRVAFTQDRHAILVPASFPSDVQYTASTVGVLSTCQSPFSLVGASIAAAPPGQQNQSSDEGYFTDLGYYVAPGGGFGVNILYCNVTVGDVVYRYSSSTSTFQTVSFNDSSLRTTQLVATLSDSGDMSANIAFILLAGASADEYALELSREMIGMSAWIWQPAQIQMINGIEQIIGTKIHTIPLILYLATIGSMCILTLAVCVQATVRSYKVPFTHLARMRLTSLLPMIHLLFGPIDAARTWKEGGTGLFNVESEAHRLNIGPIETLGERSFGVTMAEVEADSAPPTDLEGNHNAEESVRRRRRRNVLELDTEEVGDAKERYLIPDLRLSPAFPSSVSELEESCGLLDGNPM